MNPYRLRAYIELLIVALIWGIAGVVIKYTLGGFPTLIFLSYRFLIATAVALGFFIFGGFKIPKDRKTLALVLFNGFLITTVSLGLLFWGTDKTTAIDATLISAIAPITIVIAGAIFLKENVTTREKIGIMIAFVGTLITIAEPILRRTDGTSGLTGNLLVFASVLVSTATAVLAKIILRKEVDALFATNISFVVGFLTILPLTLFVYSSTDLLHLVASVPLSYHLGVFYMAILSGTLGYYLWHKAEKTIEISEANLIAYLYPIIGTPLAVLWLKEKITTPFIIGAVIIAIGIVIAEWKKKRYN